MGDGAAREVSSSSSSRNGSALGSSIDDAVGADDASAAFNDVPEGDDSELVRRLRAILRGGAHARFGDMRGGAHAAREDVLSERPLISRRRRRRRRIRSLVCAAAAAADDLRRSPLTLSAPRASGSHSHSASVLSSLLLCA